MERERRRGEGRRSRVASSFVLVWLLPYVYAFLLFLGLVYSLSLGGFRFLFYFMSG